jgi:hypothetical protein
MWKWMLPVLALAITSPAAIAGPEDDCRQNGDGKLQVTACSEIVSRGDAPAWVYESRGRAYWRRGEPMAQSPRARRPADHACFEHRAFHIAPRRDAAEVP